MSETDLPDFVKEKIQNIHERSKVDITEITKDYLDFFLSDFVQTDAQFVSDEQRHRTSLMHLWKNYVARPPAKTHEIIPIGYTESRKTQSSGKPRSVIYALIKNCKGIQSISCMGPASDLYKSMNLFCKYTVKLGQFKDGDFVADSRTKFEDPKHLGNPLALMAKLDIPKMTIKEAKENLSFVRSDGYTDSKDWRCIQAMISRKWSREATEEKEASGTYTIADDSLWYDQPQVLADGTVQAPGFTCWISPSNMAYDEDDECNFYGSVSKSRKDGSIQMNCYLVLPVHTKDQPQ